jgi:hypothetical protein
MYLSAMNKDSKNSKTPKRDTKTQRVIIFWWSECMMNGTIRGTKRTGAIEISFKIGLSDSLEISRTR